MYLLSILFLTVSLTVLTSVENVVMSSVFSVIVVDGDARKSY